LNVTSLITFRLEELSHVIEVYDFPREFKNEHIIGVFREAL
jgi:hypothetical protein